MNSLYPYWASAFCPAKDKSMSNNIDFIDLLFTWFHNCFNDDPIVGMDIIYG